jgi:SAM-dependent methyltransferase
LRHTRDLQRKYKLENLELHQLPIERIRELGRSFDLIVCTGVLHHLLDPDLGLRALRAVLRPHGAMRLMVYAPYGRAGIYMMQEYCRRVEQAPYLAQCGVVARSPHAARLAALPAPLQHAAVELFRGSMVTHSFIAYRDDRGGGSQPITFDGDRSRAYVPIALPWTVCVRERLPPGSVAVLINRAHLQRSRLYRRCIRGPAARSHRREANPGRGPAGRSGGRRRRAPRPALLRAALAIRRDRLRRIARTATRWRR